LPSTSFPWVMAMFDSKDYLYCNHVSCGRRFCSESSFEKHCLVFHGRPTCDMCGLKLKKSSKHRCAVLDCYLPLEDYPALDFMHDSDTDSYDDCQFLDENQDLVTVFSSLDVAGHDQEFEDAARHHGYTEYDTTPFYEDSDSYHPDYDGSYPHALIDHPLLDHHDYEPVEIYDSSNVFGDYSDDYGHRDYSLGTKVASPIPLPVYLSQALTQLIEKYGNVMPCDYDDSDEDADDSSGSDQTLNDDSSDPESDDQNLTRSLTWTPGISDKLTVQCGSL